jgi:hypothetical protein
LTIKVGDANEKMAESLGKSVEQLTAEEKAMAILNATLEAGDTLIAQVGGSVDSAADDFAQMEVKIKNAKDELLKGLAPAISQVVDEMTPAIDGTVGWVKASALLTDAHERNIITEEELKQQRRALLTFTLTGADAVAWLTQKEELYTETITKTANQIGLTDSWLRKYIESSEDAVEVTEDATLAADDYRYAMAGAKGAVEGLTGVLENEYAKALKATTNSVTELESMKALLKLTTQDLTEAEREQVYTQITQLHRVEELTKALDEGTITQGELRAAIIDGNITLDEFNELMGITVGITDEADRKFGNMKKSLEELAGDYNINLKFKITSIGQIPDVGGFAEKGLPVPDFQHGGSFVVPSGFTNNGMLMRVHTGEHVQVTPRGRRNRAEKVYQYFSNDRIYIQNSAHARFVIEQRFHEEMDEIDKVL